MENFDLYRHLELVTEARTIETVWQLHTSAMAEFGFDRMLYGSTQYRSGPSVGDPDDMLVLTNHTPEYIEYLFQDRRMIRGPMSQWCLENEGCRSWSLLHELVKSGALGESEMEIFNFNQTMGVHAGYSISFQALSKRFRAAIGLIARVGLSQDDVDNIWNEHGGTIHLINKVMHLQAQQLPRQNARPLTLRQQQVLDWIGDGKSVSDTAMLMNVSTATVEKHLRLAREALNAETTAQAVLKRAFQNQVFTLEDAAPHKGPPHKTP